MARALYDFLNESFLLHGDNLADGYAAFSDERLEAELQSYRTHVLSVLKSIQAEAEADTVGPKAYVGAANGQAVDRITLKRMALYFDRAIIDDPLFPLTRRVAQDHQELAKFFGHQPPETVNRAAVVRAASLLNKIRPLVGFDFLRIVPMSVVNEPPSQLNLTYSETLFAERVPQGLREWFRSRVTVKAMRRTDEGWRTINAPLEPCRAILIEFDGFDHPMIFHLTQGLSEPVPERPNAFRFIQRMPDEPPAGEMFNAWVTQSMNQFAGHIFQWVRADVVSAATTNSMLLTDSGLVADMLNLLPSPHGQVDRDIPMLSLMLSLPSIDDASEETLMRVRRDNPHSFEAFRIVLERGLREISSCTDVSQQQRQLDELRHELENLQVRAVQLSLNNLQRGLLRDASLGVVSLALTAPTGGVSLLGLLTALAKGVHRIDDYFTSAKGKPGHFLLKLQRKLNEQ